METHQSSHMKEVERLLAINRGVLERGSKEDVVELTMLLRRILLRYADALYGPREAASLFNRRKSWIYDAMTRPRTPLQRRLNEIACREDGGLLFRLSDLIAIRRELFKSASEDGSCPK